MKKTEGDQVETAYSESQATVYDENRFVTKAGAAIHKVELSKVLEVLTSLPKNSRVVEIGCGTGRILVECLERGYQVHGADASSEMLKQLQTKLDSQSIKTQLDQCEAAKLPYEDGSYDFAYTVRLLNQTESPVYALSVVKEMVRIVKPGGYILIESVNARRAKVGRNKTKSTRLKSSEIITEAKKAGAAVEKTDGAFLVGMGAYPRLGDIGVPLICGVDKVLSGLFPDVCARIYVLLKKQEERDAG